MGKTLDSLAGLVGLDRVTIYVSQDGKDTAVANVVQQYGQGALAPPHTSFFEHWQRDRVPQLGPDQASYMAYDSSPSRPQTPPSDTAQCSFLVIVHLNACFFTYLQLF